MTQGARALAALLARRGLRDVAGVPCSILEPLQRAVEAAPELRYLPASVEGEAVAAAAGAWLGGGGGVALLQNSGLGNAVNPLASLALPYRIPLLLVVSWRGRPGEADAAQHRPMGAATRALLDLLEIPTVLLRAGDRVDAVVGDAIEKMERRRTPVALLVPRGAFGRPEPRPTPESRTSERDVGAAGRVARFGGGKLPSRAEVLAAFRDRCGAGAVIATTGFTSRELEAHGREARHFPMQGSMGFAAAIGLGLARVRPRTPVFVLDGDGAALMRLGTLATVGATRPANLVHLVLDNGRYASTGGQPTLSAAIDFPGVAAACGYARVASCAGREGIADALDWARGAPGAGPSFLHLRIDCSEPRDVPRPSRPPPAIAAALRRRALETPDGEL